MLKLQVLIDRVGCEMECKCCFEYGFEVYDILRVGVVRVVKGRPRCVHCILDIVFGSRSIHPEACYVLKTVAIYDERSVI
jgi:hypothetical protein